MYETTELAAFAVREFKRGLEGLTAEEALVRHDKPDGTQMNAISWTVRHIAHHWQNAGRAARGEALERQMGDVTPPPYDEALALLDETTRDLGWVSEVGDEAMSRRPPELRGESVGTFLARAVMHTWFHIGEINAARQLLGHGEIRFVGALDGWLDWVAEGSRG